MNLTRRWLRLFVCLSIALLAARSVFAQADQPIYTDALTNGWQSYGWATLNYANTSPVHSGIHSISVSETNYGALYLAHAAFSTGAYTNLTFWLNGGPTGGQHLKVQAHVNGSAQNEFYLPTLSANTWQPFTIPLSSLNAANVPNMDGFWIQETISNSVPNLFYVDDIKLTAAPMPAVVHLALNAAQPVRTVDARLFAVNTAVWDSSLDTPGTAAVLSQMDMQAMRFPGGSTADDYHWASNSTGTNTWSYTTSFDNFAHLATNLHSQVFITVNYGSGTVAEATNWVRYSNVTKNYGFKYWEIGNENYGGWETDTNAAQHDPYTYATQAKSFYTGMKAADPSIKVGVVVITGEDAYANNTNHPVTNPRTGQVHNGWTPVLLTTLKNLGVTPQFVIYHRYAQNQGQENDASLLQSSATWTNDAIDLRQQLTDYLGAAGTNVELLCTENNSVSSGPGKQTTSLVNGLFLADSAGQIMQTEFNSMVWWDLRNGSDTNFNNDPSLYGWRQYGNYGIIDGGTNGYPTFYVGKLLKYFVRAGDRIVHASSDFALLSVYAAKRTNAAVTLLVINKSPTATLNGAIAIAGYTPGTNAVVYSYGIPQDEAVHLGTGSPDIAQTSFTSADTNFSYSFPPYSATVISLSPAPPKLTVPAVRPDGHFQFQLNGEPGARYYVQSSTNLLISNWPAIATNALITNALNWVDPQPAGSATRYYRALWAP